MLSDSVVELHHCNLSEGEVGYAKEAAERKGVCAPELQWGAMERTGWRNIVLREFTCRALGMSLSNGMPGAYLICLLVVANTRKYVSRCLGQRARSRVQHRSPSRSPVLVHGSSSRRSCLLIMSATTPVTADFSSPPLKRSKIVLLGDQSVGKTSLITRYASQVSCRGFFAFDPFFLPP